MGSPVDIRDGKANSQVEAYCDENTLYIGAVLPVDDKNRAKEAKDSP